MIKVGSRSLAPLIALALAGCGQESAAPVAQTPEQLTEAARAHPENAMDVDVRSWSLGGFGVVAIATLDIVNHNGFAVKDVGVRCTGNGESGTPISHLDRTIFQSIGAGKHKRVKNFNLGLINSQARGLSCAVTSATAH